MWEDFVIARFLETAPHVAKVHMIVNKIWAFGEKNQKLDVFEMDATTMRVRVTNEKIRSKVVRRGMWNIAGVPMVVSNWSPEEDDSKASLIPLWVHVSNVPMNMYSWEGLSFITSAAGVPDHLHPETIACTNFEIAKVFVKADLSKELPEKITYTIQGKETTVLFNYPWLPPKCVKCGRWGHYETGCKENKKGIEGGEKVMTTPVKVLDTTTRSSYEIEESAVVEDLALRSDNKDMEDGSKMGERRGESRGDIVGMEMEEGQINEWRTVAMEKAGRSPKSPNLKYCQVTIATPSRFAVLSNSEENEAEIEKEESEELEEIEMEVESAEDLCQRKLEESMEEKTMESKRGRVRLPRQSKTNHRIISGKVTNKNL